MKKEATVVKVEEILGVDEKKVLFYISAESDVDIFNSNNTGKCDAHIFNADMAAKEIAERIAELKRLVFSDVAYGKRLGASCIEQGKDKNPYDWYLDAPFINKLVISNRITRILWEKLKELQK